MEQLTVRAWPMREGRAVHDGNAIPHDDPRWPASCACGYAFTPDDSWQCNPDTLYRRSDTGELVTMDAAPAGAMWFAPWLSDHESWRGPDGNTLVVRVPPGHDWIVDSTASNCDSPCAKCGVPRHKHKSDACQYQDARPHKCWIRHGTPPNVTVDKAGVTCGAGAGSIKTPQFHGFLKAGELSGELSGPAPAATPAVPSPYVRISDILKKTDEGMSAATLAETYAREAGQSLPQSELDRALSKGRTKGTFVESGGTWRHVTRTN